MDKRLLPGRTRDPERSREAILDAAEELFAEGGYEATSLQASGARAGVSRGTPGYFFGAKEALYEAVLARIFAAERELIAAAQADGTGTAPGGTLEAELTAVAASFIEFLAARPHYVRLLEREALAGGGALRATAVHAASVQEGLDITSALLGREGARATDPASFFLAMLALCWFPFAHADTFGRDLGFDLRQADDRDRWQRFIVDLVLHGIQAR